MPERKPRNEGAGAFIGINNSRIDPNVLKHRFEERDARLANDDRNAAAKWLGDPPSARSALATREVDRAVSALISRLRWRRYLLHQPPVLYYLTLQRLGLYRNPFAARG